MGNSKGINPALDARIYERLVADFGEEKARSILGGEPAGYRKRVPKVVGVKPKRAPALVPNPNRVKGVSWRDRDDRLERPRVRTIIYRRQVVECYGCGRDVLAGDEHLLLTWTGGGRQYRYCPPCGAEAAKGGAPR